MARGGYYYRLKEAEELKQTYSSWVNKKAHAGNGTFAILKCIKVRPRRSAKTFFEVEKVYSVQFEFENKIKLDAQNFLLNNGLTAVVSYIASGETTG